MLFIAINGKKRTKLLKVKIKVGYFWITQTNQTFYMEAVLEQNTETIAPEITSETKAVAETGTPSETINATETKVIEPVELDDAAFLAQYNKRMGFEGDKAFTTLEQLKPAAPAPTEEEVKKANSQKELTLAERFVSKKGRTLKEFNILQQVANSDPKEFALQEARQELVNAGFKPDEVDEEMKARYYQLSDEEKANLSEEDAELLKKNEYFTNKLANKGSYKIQQAKDVLRVLEQEMEAENYVKQVDANISATVAEIAKKMERKVVLDMGLSNGQTLNPVEYTIDEADILEIESTLSDKAKREQFLYNQDGSENVGNLFEALKWKKIAQSLAKKALIQGADEQVTLFNSKFPSNPHSVAPGNVAKTGRTGQIGKAIEGTEKTIHRQSVIQPTK